MAWAPSLLGRPLLLTLLSTLWGPTRGDRNLVLVPPEVRGSPGDTVNLTCVLQPVESETQRVTEIKWQRLEPWGDLSTVAEFHWVRGTRILEPDHVQFVAAGQVSDLLNSSLTLTELHPDDDANYTCQVTTYPNGSWKASTWVRVFYAPQVSISLYDDIGQQGDRKTSLSCDARCNPEPRSYEWSTTTGSLPPSAVPQGSRLLLQPSEEAINITFICCVSNDLGTSQASMRVQLPGEEKMGSTDIPDPSKEQSWSSSALKIVLFVGLVVVLHGVHLALIYFRWFRKSCHDQHSSSENKEVLPFRLDRMALEPCEIEMEDEAGTKSETKAGIKQGTEAGTETTTEKGAKTENKAENTEENKTENVENGMENGAVSWTAVRSEANEHSRSSLSSSIHGFVVKRDVKNPQKILGMLAQSWKWPWSGEEGPAKPQPTEALTAALTAHNRSQSNPNFTNLALISLRHRKDFALRTLGFSLTELEQLLPSHVLAVTDMANSCHNVSHKSWYSWTKCDHVTPPCFSILTTQLEATQIDATVV